MLSVLEHGLGTLFNAFILQLLIDYLSPGFLKKGLQALLASLAQPGLFEKGRFPGPSGQFGRGSLTGRLKIFTARRTKKES